MQMMYNSTISAQVVSLGVVNGLGEELTISDPDDLNAFKINLGLLGMISQLATISLTVQDRKSMQHCILSHCTKCWRTITLYLTKYLLTVSH